MFSLVSVCHFTGDGSHVTITNDALDLIVQGCPHPRMDNRHGTPTAPGHIIRHGNPDPSPTHSPHRYWHLVVEPPMVLTSGGWTTYVSYWIAFLVTARKQSLGQGNVFTGVYLSMGALASQHASQVTWPGGLPSGRSASRDVLLRGLHAGGPASGGWQIPLPPPLPEIHGTLRDTVNKRVVSILLECFLFEIISRKLKHQVHFFVQSIDRLVSFP